TVCSTSRHFLIPLNGHLTPPLLEKSPMYTKLADLGSDVPNGPDIHAVIPHLFNTSLITGTIPSRWNHSTIFSYCVRSPTAPADHRSTHHRCLLSRTLGDIWPFHNFNDFVNNFVHFYALALFSSKVPFTPDFSNSESRWEKLLFREFLQNLSSSALLAPTQHNDEAASCNMQTVQLNMLKFSVLMYTQYRVESLAAWGIHITRSHELTGSSNNDFSGRRKTEFVDQGPVQQSLHCRQWRKITLSFKGRILGSNRLGGFRYSFHRAVIYCWNYGMANLPNIFVHHVEPNTAKRFHKFRSDCQLASDTEEEPRHRTIDYSHASSVAYIVTLVVRLAEISSRQSYERDDSGAVRRRWRGNVMSSALRQQKSKFSVYAEARKFCGSNCSVIIVIIIIKDSNISVDTDTSLPLCRMSNLAPNLHSIAIGVVHSDSHKSFRDVLRVIGMQRTRKPSQFMHSAKSNEFPVYSSITCKSNEMVQLTLELIWNIDQYIVGT
ncbi:hypothetical protein CLF_112714, partial [Clonorchis sinensis]